MINLSSLQIEMNENGTLKPEDAKKVMGILNQIHPGNIQRKTNATRSQQEDFELVWSRHSSTAARYYLLPAFCSGELFVLEWNTNHSTLGTTRITTPLCMEPSLSPGTRRGALVGQIKAEIAKLKFLQNLPNPPTDHPDWRQMALKIEELTEQLNQLR